jgi:soluble lytic murein transglycosylase-like protein
MVKDLIKDCANLKYRRVSLQYLLLALVMIIVLAVVYTVTVPGKPANADYSVSLKLGRANVKEMAKEAILEWMKKNSEMPEQVLSKIYRVAVNSVNTDLILAICVVESNFNPYVESDRGAIGLMGIMPTVWLKELKEHRIVSGKEDLYSISKNIDSGVYVLESYLKRTNNLRDALSRYSGGDPSYATRVLRMLTKISRTRRLEKQLSLATLRTEE